MSCVSVFWEAPVSIVRNISCSAIADGEDDTGKTGRDATDGKEGEADQGPGSNSSTLSASSQITEKDSPNSSFSSEEHSSSEYEIVRNVMYSTRENINIVHEIFRQVCPIDSASNYSQTCHISATKADQFEPYKAYFNSP